MLILVDQARAHTFTKIRLSAKIERHIPLPQEHFSQRQIFSIGKLMEDRFGRGRRATEVVVHRALDPWVARPTNCATFYRYDRWTVVKSELESPRASIALSIWRVPEQRTLLGNRAEDPCFVLRPLTNPIVSGRQELRLFLHAAIAMSAMPMATASAPLKRAKSIRETCRRRRAFDLENAFRRHRGRDRWRSRASPSMYSRSRRGMMRRS